MPSSIANSCPPPWPNKYPNRNQYQYNNKYISARITTGQRPPPWPNKNNTTPISLITNSHLSHWPNHTVYQPTASTPPACPPPWPILLPNILQNHQNARCQLRQRSQILSSFSWTFTYPTLILILHSLISLHHHSSLTSHHSFHFFL